MAKIHLVVKPHPYCQEAPWVPPSGCLAIDPLTGSRKPGPLRDFCNVCPNQPFRGPGCFWRDHLDDREEQEERLRKRQAALSGICAWPGCPEAVSKRARFCPEHKWLVQSYHRTHKLGSFEEAEEIILQEEERRMNDDYPWI